MSKLNVAATKKKTLALIAPIDPAEVACRLIEATDGTRRPVGFTAREAIERLPQLDREAVMRAAHAVLEYISECIRNAQQPS